MTASTTTRLSDFCFAADENYTMPLKVCVSSLIWSMRGELTDISVHVLDLGIDDSTWIATVESWKILVARVSHAGDGIVKFVRHKIDKCLFDGMMPWRGSVATYARLLLPKLLPDVRWCLYSDGDVLFIESPMSLDSYCQDQEVSVLGHKNPPWCDQIDGMWFRANNLAFNESKHVCAGLLLMNLEFFRLHDLSNKALEFLRAHKTTASADQCAINYVCYDSLRLLPSRWGVFNGEICDDSVGEGGAIHYADGAPWKPPLNCTMLLGYNPMVVKLWRKFACNIVGVGEREVKPRFNKMISVYVRACIVWCILKISWLPGLETRRYKNWPGQFIKRTAIRRYENCLFN